MSCLWILTSLRLLLYNVPDKPLSHLCLPHFLILSEEQSSGVEKLFVQASSEKLGVEVWWPLNTIGMKHSWSVFHFPPKLNMRLNLSWLYFVCVCVFLVWYIFSFPTIVLLSPSVCDFSVANLSDPPEKGRCLPLLCWSSLLLTSTQLKSQRVKFNKYLQKNSFVQGTGLDPAGNLGVRDTLALPKAYNLVKKIIIK